MKYFGEMFNRRGFCEGVYPIGIEVYRDQYIMVVNFFAAKIGSRYRLVAGCYTCYLHNSIRIEWQALDDTETNHHDLGTEGAMCAAIDCAFLYNPDQYIEIDLTDVRDGVWSFSIDPDIEFNLEAFEEKVS